MRRASGGVNIQLGNNEPMYVWLVNCCANRCVGVDVLSPESPECHCTLPPPGVALLPGRMCVITMRFWPSVT